MTRLAQTPAPGTALLATAGDILEVSLQLDGNRAGSAFFRANLGHAAARRQEVVAHTERDEPPLARDWHDLPMRSVGHGLFALRVPLIEVGWFAGKTCFIPAGSDTPVWPAGDNLVVKVEPAHAACANAIYTAFVRSFGPALKRDPRTPARRRLEARLDALGYAVIPPSGTFRDVIRRLDTILGAMRFRVVQLLPIHPAPTTFARMGRFGSPFAGLDFLGVDPALAEFDRRATPLDQFRELVDAVHARGARLFLDMPANHTGWASTLQIHHPEWFQHAAGAFTSPGAWGVTWEDLVALDYRHPALRAHMADVFLFWVRQGVDGFRCDAGYMVPAETWTYIVARVREEFPDTIFLLEGLGGTVEATERLLAGSNLDWAYSELFQIGDRPGFERYLPAAIALGARTGPLAHYAETHDNLRLAASGEAHARLRTALAALLSQQGAFGITAGVEWFARERIDVHGASPLDWGAPRNQVKAIARLNALLATHPAFAAGAVIRCVQEGPGNVLAVVRRAAPSANRTSDPAYPANLLILANLDTVLSQSVHWPAGEFEAQAALDLLTGAEFPIDGKGRLDLAPGQVVCLTTDPADVKDLGLALRRTVREPAAIVGRRRNLLALRVRRWLAGSHTLGEEDVAALGVALERDPLAYCASVTGTVRPRVVVWDWPCDTRRTVMVPPGNLLLVRAPYPFRARLAAGDRVLAADESLPVSGNRHVALLPMPPAGPSSVYAGFDAATTGLRDAAAWQADRRASMHGAAAGHTRLELSLRVFAPDGVQRAASDVLALRPGAAARVAMHVSGTSVRREGHLRAVLGNGAGAALQACAAWGEIRSQYDALLAVNPDSHAPADRQVFFTRCRAWLRHRGYSHAIDATCLDTFEVAPDGSAAWRFQVPTGVGCWVELVFRLRLVPDRNRLLFEIVRPVVRGGLPDADGVTVVLRPDIEWRSAHGKTKAYAGPEQRWPAAIRAEPHGFEFHPGTGGTYAIRTGSGTFHHEPEWQYMVAHPEDAARGLDGTSDLFSPGWFGIDLLGGERVTVVAENRGADPAGAAPVPPAAGGVAANPDASDAEVRPPREALPLPDALRRAIDLFLARRDDGLAVLAGYPWFLDWGRDTLIVLRGLVAAGRADDALRILCGIGREEDRGTLPNMIRGGASADRDTSDAPLWFGVAAADLIAALGPAAVLDAPCGRRPVREVLVSIAAHYRDGTPNGIRMDPGSALIFSPAHFTWMDTNYPAGTPREGYPIEIQALWIALLRLLGTHADKSWADLGARAAVSLSSLFRLRDEEWLADNLRAVPGMPASQATPEDALRPNQLLALTLDAFEGGRERAAGILRGCETLLVPGGIRSLADRTVRVAQPVARDGRLLNDPERPYWGQYTGAEDTRRKPAYHNGTAWTWQFPLYAEALVKVYGDEARADALALLGSATVAINAACLGQIPEVLDGDAPHAPRGCVAQAWSVSELLRVWQVVAGK